MRGLLDTSRVFLKEQKMITLLVVINLAAIFFIVDGALELETLKERKARAKLRSKAYQSMLVNWAAKRGLA